ADAIARDNTLWLTTALKAQGTAIGVFSPHSPESLGVKSIPGYSFVQVSAEDLRSPKLNQRIRALIAYRSQESVPQISAPLLAILTNVPGVAELMSEPVSAELSSWAA